MAVPRRGYVLDLHNHTHHSDDGVMPPLDLLLAAARRGVDCLGVTDHGTVRGGLEAARLSASDPRLPRVIPGQEVLTRQGEVIGLYLCEDIPSGLTLDQAVAAIRAQGGLVYLPHPYDSLRHATISRGALERAAGLADIVEVENGRSLCRRYDRLSRKLAVRHGKVLGAGSDAHYPGECGRTVLEVERPPAPDGLPVGLATAPPVPPGPSVPPTADDLLTLLRDARLVHPHQTGDRLLTWWFVARVGVDKLRRRFARASNG